MIILLRSFFMLLPAMAFLNLHAYLATILFPVLTGDFSFLKRRAVRPLLLISGISLISSLIFYHETPFDGYLFFRGCYYFVLPVFLLGFGMALYHFSKDVDTFLKHLVAVLVFYEIFSLLLHLRMTGSFATDDINVRSTGYLTTELSLLPILSFWMFREKKYLLPQKVLYPLFLLGAVIVVMSFSRTNQLQMIVCVTLLVLCSEKADRFFLYSVLLLFFANFFLGEWYYENFMGITEEVDYTHFWDKITNSYNEWLIVPRSTPTEINNNWRGFEAWLGKKSVMDIGGLAPYIGLGFQAIYNSDIFADAERSLNYLPIFHNGFITIFQKAGFAGLFLFCCFLLQVFPRNTIPPEERSYDRLLRILTVLLVLTTFLMHGLYCATPPYFLLIAMGGLLERKSMPAKTQEVPSASEPTDVTSNRSAGS